MLLESGRLDEADATIARAMDVPAEDVRSNVVALRVLAAVRAAQGRQDEARDALDVALQTASEASYGTEVRLTEEAQTRLLA